MSRSIAAAAALLVAAGTTSLGAQSATGTIAGVIVAADGGWPLAYGVVSLPALRQERFASMGGTFEFKEVPAGPTVVRVRRLGFTPKEITIAVHSGETDTVRVELTRLALRLAQVEVRDFAPCFTPGVPSADKDSVLASIHTQLLINAEQLRLMSEAHPFSYGLESTMYSVGKDGVKREEEVDTVRVRSETNWKYRPGQVLRASSSGKRTGMLLPVPTLLNFADADFGKTHCFHNSGLVSDGEGGQLIRVDAIAWERIRGTDINVTILLDPASFQIRRTIVRLWNAPRSRSGKTDFSVTTEFREVLESIPVINSVTSRRSYDPRSRESKILYAVEEHRILGFTWLGQKPGEDPRQ